MILFNGNRKYDECKNENIFEILNTSCRQINILDFQNGSYTN